MNRKKFSEIASTLIKTRFVGKIAVGIIYKIFNLSCMKLAGNNRVHVRGFMLLNKITIKGRNNEVVIRSDLLINSDIYIKGDNNRLILGANTLIKDSDFWLEDDDNTINIGNKTSIEGAHVAALEGTKISVGEDCMLSNHIVMRTSDSHAIYDMETNKRINEAKDIMLENHVWVGSYVKIMKGVKINSGAIIALGSIVTKNVADNIITGGIPGSQIKSSVYWTRERERLNV